MRIAIAHIGQETSSFTPKVTTLDSYRNFGLYEGAEILEKDSTFGILGGFFEAAREENIDLVPLPTIRAWAGASGTLTAETLAWFEKKLADGLASLGQIDGFYFSQHGAAAAENEPDVEGRLLAVARSVIGPNIPIISPLDHHGNITALMMKHMNGLVGHRTQPHLPFDTGKRAAQMLFATVRGDVKPTMGWRKIPLITHQEQFLTSKGPMKRWFDRAREMETMPGVLAASPFPMQPWLDVPEGGWTAVVTTDNDPALAQRLADELADMAWAMRDEFLVTESIPAADAVRRAEQAARGLVIISDTGDSVFGGAPGDSTAILREMVAQQITSLALVPMVDPEVVNIAIKAGVGSEIHVRIGAKQSADYHQPLDLTAKVLAIGGGRIEAGVIGIDSFDMGRAVLLAAGSVRIVVSETEGIGGNHPIVYRHFGIEPADAKMVVLKTASNFQYYADMSSELIRADTAGATMSDLAKFEWKHLPRPIYPFDRFDA